MNSKGIVIEVSEKHNAMAVVFEAYNPMPGQVKRQLVWLTLDGFDSAYVGMCVKTTSYQHQPNDDLYKYYTDTDKSKNQTDTKVKELY
jgi:hypothetical protein